MQPRILVIDDDAGARTMLDYLLTPDGYEIHTAENGAAGFALMQEWTPDIILCDLMMPEMNGQEFCRRVRATPAVAQIPILLLTALGDRIVKLESLEAGADEFITKPIDPAELRADD